MWGPVAASWTVRVLELNSKWIATIMASSADEETYVLESVVRGHHVYKAYLDPVIGESLQVHCEGTNSYDTYAVATSRNGNVVGHVPTEFSSIFLQHGGRISCEITGRRKVSTMVLKGLVVPCTYTYFGKPAMIIKVMEQ